MAQNELHWITPVRSDAMLAGVFNTVLTDISGNTLTSTATIDSFNLTDDGRSITCRGFSNAQSWNTLYTILVHGKYRSTCKCKCTIIGVVL